MSDVPDFAPSSNSEASEYVRSLTDYEDSADELPQSELSQHLEMAKLRMYNELSLDGDEFYHDPALGQALVASTAIYCKLAVENYSVSRWRIADQEIETSGMTEMVSAQLQSWSEMYRKGIRKSESSNSSGPTNTAGYIG